jgi:1-acyl-sn-glycerol-3-phosphate acyltransferase
MTSIRIFFRAIIFIFLILAYVLTSLFWRVWTQDQIKRRHHYTRTVSFFCKFALRLLNFKILARNLPSQDESFLIIGNHMGILDIFVLASLHPSLFITSVDMRQTAGLGFLTEMGGCLYVNRRSRSQINREIEQIREALKQKFSVVLYPEGMSSNGERVLPFKKSLLVSAAGTGIPILPAAINYRKVNGEPMSHRWRDYVCWYGDQTFLPFVKRILSVKSVEVEIEFGEQVEVHTEEQRREVAISLQKWFIAKFDKIPLPTGVPSPFSHIPQIGISEAENI